MAERTFLPEELARQIYEIMIRHLRASSDPWLEWSFCHALSKIGIDAYPFDSKLTGGKIMMRPGNSPIVVFSDDSADIQKLAALVNARIAKAYDIGTMPTAHQAGTLTACGASQFS